MRLHDWLTILIAAISIGGCSAAPSTLPPATTVSPTHVETLTPSATLPTIQADQLEIVKALRPGDNAVACQDNSGPPPGIVCDNLGNVIRLAAPSQHLKSLPPDISKLSSLQFLDLSGNELNTLPAEIGKLKSLQILDLSRNELESLPPEIGQLTNLRILYLSYNNLATLPPEIGKLSSLTYLEAIQSHLKTIPPEVGQLSNLTQLNLVENELTNLPPEIAQLHNLKGIGLQGNPINSLSPEICAKLKSAISPPGLCP
jgi:Leucine-rich repeat (LRR) protein